MSGWAIGDGRWALRDRRLWLDVAVVVALAAGWLGVSASVGGTSPSQVADYLPLGLYLVPVLYAAIRFGITGALAVTVAVAVVSVPWAVVSLGRQDVLGAWANLVQVASLLVVAAVVGRAVSSEREARMAAEEARQAHVVAESRFRELFDANVDPVLLVDMAGSVVEANAAAVALAGPPAAGADLSALVGRALADRLLAGGEVEPVELAPPDGDGGPRLYRPVVTPTLDIGGRPMRQIVLRNVTDEARRQRRTQAYAADVLAGQEDERRRIAQELHDGPVQNLVQLCRRIDDLVPTAAGGQLREMAESVVAEVRRISQGLRPHVLDDLGLAAALGRLCDDFRRTTGVRAHLVIGALDPLSRPLELTVFRIAQEALSNAARHADASIVTVELATSPGLLRMRVEDDGVGYDAAVAGDGDTMGMHGMAERAALMGGTVTVTRSGGGGVSVLLSVPLDGGAPVPERGRPAKAL